jgi:flavodoxin
MMAQIVLVSYHNQNTRKVAEAMASVLHAPVVSPQQFRIENMREHGLIGFGSGVYGGKHHRSLLDLVDGLPAAGSGKTCAETFLFSTFGAPASTLKSEERQGRAGSFVRENHSALRQRLESKGYPVVGEFACPGLNTNSFLRLFGGLNKGRPSEEDLRLASEFAVQLEVKVRKGIETRMKEDE